MKKCKYIASPASGGGAEKEERGGQGQTPGRDEEFFNGIPCSIETKIKVILEDEGNDIINQYILFSKILDEQIRIYGSENKNEAIKEAFRICKERNILKEFIESHEAGEPAHLKCAPRMGQAYVLS